MTDLVTRLRALADELPIPGLNVIQAEFERDVASALREAADALEKRKSYDESEAKRAHDFENALGQCQAERDAIKANLAGASALLEHARDCHVETAKRAEKAEAEAAALRDALDDIAFWRCGCGATWASDKAKEALSQPGPGAALRERVKKLEAVVTALHNQHPMSEDLHHDVINALAALEET